jgi:hypothetical protein
LNFIEALGHDVHCFQALQSLIDNYMLSVGEEKTLLDKISFEGIPKFEADFIKSLYLSKLTKHTDLQVESTHLVLQDRYHLKGSPLITVGKAEQLMIQRNFEAAFNLLEKYSQIK